MYPSSCLDILPKVSAYNCTSASALTALINFALSVLVKPGISNPALSHR